MRLWPTRTVIWAISSPRENMRCMVCRFGAREDVKFPVEEIMTPPVVCLIYQGAIRMVSWGDRLVSKGEKRSYLAGKRAK